MVYSARRMNSSMVMTRSPIETSMFSTGRAGDECELDSSLQLTMISNAYMSVKRCCLIAEFLSTVLHAEQTDVKTQSQWYIDEHYPNVQRFYSCNQFSDVDFLSF